VLPYDLEDPELDREFVYDPDLLEDGLDLPNTLPQKPGLEDWLV
jgi:hypothetical protein